tara:strand:- start:1355 stop:1471 length:117 start_codon:yes stop_codon:yes gene_type:complete
MESPLLKMNNAKIAGSKVYFVKLTIINGEVVITKIIKN